MNTFIFCFVFAFAFLGEFAPSTAASYHEAGLISLDLI